MLVDNEWVKNEMKEETKGIFRQVKTKTQPPKILGEPKKFLT